MSVIGNLIWILFGGLLTALEYLFSSVILMITIIGIPFGLQTLKLASLAIWPFGRTTVQEPSKSGCLSVLMNIVWIVFGGIWISLSHLLFGILLAITVIGLPFARQHFKLAVVALTPFGRKIVQVQ